MESSHEPNCNRHHRDSGTAHKHHTVTAGLYIQGSQLTLWDWKSEGGEVTGSDGSTTQKHHTVTAGLYTQASQLTLWDWKSEGGEGTGSDGSTTQKHHTVTAGLYTQASQLTLWDWKSEGGEVTPTAKELAVTAALHRSITVIAGLYVQASPLTLWDWKSEGARESDSEGTASDGSTTQKHYSDSRNIHTSITTHIVGLEERGGEGIRQRGNCQ